MIDFLNFYKLSLEERMKDPYYYCDNCGKRYLYWKCSSGFGITFREYCSLNCKKHYLKFHYNPQENTLSSNERQFNFLTKHA